MLYFFRQILHFNFISGYTLQIRIETDILKYKLRAPGIPLRLTGEVGTIYLYASSAFDIFLCAHDNDNDFSF